MKSIDINKSIYELTEEYPELIDVLREIGFKDITNPFSRKTAGKVMTLTKGCRMKDMDIDEVLKKLRNLDGIIKASKLNFLDF
jgi:multimeric flavodoxin WrbA